MTEASKADRADSLSGKAAPSGEDQDYQIELPEFEGPLDLLLHLVKRHELSIIEIPISFVTEKYLAHLEMMRALNIDVAGEYLLMAATLAHIKSRELLPRPDLPEDEEGEDSERDPKAELIRRLLEYQRYKEVAAGLGEQPLLGRQVFERGAQVEKPDPKDRPLAEVGVFALLESLSQALQRSKTKLRYDVVIDRISITDRINEIVDRLAAAPTIRFLDCFRIEQGEVPRHEIVVTFLAILELARLRMIRILQHEQGDGLFLTRTADLKAVEEADTRFD